MPRNYIQTFKNSVQFYSTGFSPFHWQIKLFREWNPKWPTEFKCKLQEKINEIDPKVGEKIINELKRPHSMHNGDASLHLNVNGTSGYTDSELEQPSDVAETIPSTIDAETTPAAVAVAVASTANDVIGQTLETITDNQLAAVLRQETPVDDEDHDQLQPQLSAGTERNSDTNGINASSPSAAVTTIAVNISPAEEPPSQSQPQAIVEPVEQVENNVSASVIVSVSATAAEVVPVA